MGALVIVWPCARVLLRLDGGGQRHTAGRRSFLRGGNGTSHEWVGANGARWEDDEANDY